MHFEIRQECDFLCRFSKSYIVLTILFCLFFAVDDMTFQYEEDTEYEIAGHQNNFKLKSALCLQETMTLG